MGKRIFDLSKPISMVFPKEVLVAINSGTTVHAMMIDENGGQMEIAIKKERIPLKDRFFGKTVVAQGKRLD